MQILVCVSSISPCPIEHQVWTEMQQLTSPEAVGITAESVGQAIAWGFAFVLFAYLIGFAGGAAIRMIRKL